VELPGRHLIAKGAPLVHRLRADLARWAGAEGVLGRQIRRHRIVFCLLMCGGLSAISYTLAFLMRFEMSPLDQPRIEWHDWWWKSIAIVVAIRLATFLLLGLHRVSWRYASARDIVPVSAAVALGSIVIVPAVMLIWAGKFPRSVLAIDPLVNMLLVGGARYTYRIAAEILTALGAGHREKVLVIGAGHAGSLTVRAMLTSQLVDYWPVGLLDDDAYKKGTTIQGVPVLGPVDVIQEAVLRTGATAIVLAIPKATSSELYRIVGLCRATGLPLKTIPDYGQIMRSSSVVTRLHDFRVEDLMERGPVRTDVPEIRDFLHGHVVLVTGAAGSIGSELCRQIVEGDDAVKLICLDKDENGLFRLEHRLRALGGAIELAFFLGDMRDRQRMDALFGTYKPEVVFHAAAYKHVPILQYHPVEAVRNNVGGTRNLVDRADEHGVETFVLISTDKAVRPTSVMGATKRIAEQIVRARDLTSATRFCTIRFGNVLGSNGSVVELFLQQIRDGRPVTVTHPDIERYFMTIPEAVHLVLFAATMGEGGEVFILDMGEPIKIDQLARNLIQLSGLTPDVDVPIEYTGLRPGEKLYEDLWTGDEEPAPTSHPGIRVSRRREPNADVPKRVANLLQAGELGDEEACWSGILDLVPTFQGATNHAAVEAPTADLGARPTRAHQA